MVFTAQKRRDRPLTKSDDAGITAAVYALNIKSTFFGKMCPNVYQIVSPKKLKKTSGVHYQALKFLSVSLAASLLVR